MARNEDPSSRRGESDFPGEPLYREMVRENERILDRQFQSLVRADEKNIFAFKLTALSLVMGLSLAAYRLQAGRELDFYVEVSLGMVLTIGTLCHVMTFLLLGQALFSLAGEQDRFTEAPREDWVLAQLKDPEHLLEDHFPAVIQGLVRAIQSNETWLARGISLRKNALRILVIGFVAHVLTAIIIYLTSL